MQLRVFSLCYDISLSDISFDDLLFGLGSGLFGLEVLYLESLDIVRDDRGAIILGSGHESYVVKGYSLGVTNKESP
jgi:hypothetical protein